MLVGSQWQDPAPEGPADPIQQPAIEPPPDFSSFTDVSAKKTAFFGYFRPLINAENERLLTERTALLRVKENWQMKGKLTAREQSKLTQWNQAFNVKAELVEDQLDILERRIHAIPPAMALAQAAAESAWGTSRFATQANNYFGQWCFTRGCGLVPNRRAAGARHEVAKFTSAQASVKAYFHNINTHPAYLGLRQARLRADTTDEPLTGYELVGELKRYSERGEEYIAELRAIIQQNRLDS